MGVVADDGSGHILLEYTPDFVASGYDPSPIFVSPQLGKKYDFSYLPYNTFNGLPGFLADCLPDRFGTAVINGWLEREGRPKDSYTAVERLLYQGSRCMGALRFEPQERKDLNSSVTIELDGLVQAAAKVFQARKDLRTNLSADDDAFHVILRVGTSAGGARAKAVVAYNPDTKDMRSGQVDAPEGYEHYLLKLDGVNQDESYNLGTTSHFGCIEYAYYRIARDCGIDMMESILLPDGDRHHFMTKRFDRIGPSHRVHMVSLCGINHMDFNDSSSWSYEQLFRVMFALHLPQPQIEQAFRRMVFNIVGCNQDDHTKNFSFLMDTDKEWKLSPAYDMTFAKGSGYTRQHQMSVNGKRSDFTRDDILSAARTANVNKRTAIEIIDLTESRFKNFRDYIDDSVPEIMIDGIQKNFITSL